MTSVRIDFAPKTFRRAIATTQPATWLLGCLGLLMSISALIAVLDLTHKINAREISLQRLSAQLAERLGRKAVIKKSLISDVQAAAINRTILQLNLPWRDVLDAIEEATPPTIALLALEPDAKKHTLKGTAEAKSSDDMIAYIEELKKQEFFGNVALVKHEINAQDPNRPLRFQFEAQWMERKQ
ncbi:MAG: PilN domain-containing protein [Burkholderiaceae bacterium]